MALNYSRESGSTFPEGVLKLNDVKDIDNSVKKVIQEYYKLIIDGDIDGAIAVKDANPGLADYWIDAAKINLLQEEVLNIGIFAQKLRKNIISDNEPEIEYDEGTAWYQEIKE